MSDLYRNTDDPLGVAFDVMVPVWTDAEIAYVKAKAANMGLRLRGEEGPPQPVPEPGPKRLIPNPAITQECGTCGGSGTCCGDDVPECHNVCPHCEGRGWTFRSSVRVAERVRVVERCTDRGPHICVSAGVVLLHSHLDRPFEDGQTEWDITHLWPEHRQGDFRCLLCGEPWPCNAEEPCPECRGYGWRNHTNPSYGDPCDDCNGKGTIRTFPKPGELWEIGWREAELVPVVDLPPYRSQPSAEDDALYRTLPATYITGRDDGRVWMVENGGTYADQHPVDITHHFPTPPKPGQRAGVLGELVLADKARKVQG